MTIADDARLTLAVLRTAVLAHGAVAANHARHLVEREGFPRDKVHVIPNGIDLDLFDASRQIDPRAAYNLPADRPIVLFSGRMERRKGLKYLLMAYSRLKWRYPNIRLIVVGSGEVKQMLVGSQPGVYEVGTGHVGGRRVHARAHDRGRPGRLYVRLQHSALPSGRLGGDSLGGYGHGHALLHN